MHVIFYLSCFHSIGIPSEWGRKSFIYKKTKETVMFPFNWDPQRVGTGGGQQTVYTCKAFPFNWDPQRVGTIDLVAVYDGL